MKLRNCFFILVYVFSLSLKAQNDISLIKILIEPDHKDWNYKIGEKVTFNIEVRKNDTTLQNVNLRYAIGLEKQKPDIIKDIKLKDGKIKFVVEGLNAPGFMSCQIFVTYKGEKYKKTIQLAFDPEKIVPETTMPSDFNAFWQKAIAENKKIDLKPTMRLAIEYSNDKVNVYEVSFQNYKVNGRIYGWLSVPKAPGKYPAVLRLPGAGVYKLQPVSDLAEKGMITLQIDIHGIPETLDKIVYDNLSEGALNNYMNFNLDNKDNYYYKRVILGCTRALDYLVTLPQYDGTNLVVYGGSQGGGLTLITTSLDTRVKYYVCYFPALCDHIAYTKGRAGGWPHMFSSQYPENNDPKKIETSKYFDAINFARNIKVPGFITFGYLDMSCPVTSMFAAYNTIPGTKELFVVKENGHPKSAIQDLKSEKWLLDHFLNQMIK